MVLNTKRNVWIEGVDNSGKSTVVERLSQKFLESKISVTIISQPRSCKLGEMIYKMHHDYDGIRIDGFSRQLLHVAAHLQGYRELQHDSSKILISDRSFISSMAYGHAYPTSEQHRNFEVRAIFDLETTLLPTELLPTNLFFFMNGQHQASHSVWEDQKKVFEGYSYVRNQPYFQNWIKSNKIKCHLVRNEWGRLNETVSLLTDLIVQ